MTWADAVTATTPDMWWRLDETSGTTIADSSGHGNVGAYQTVTLGQPSLIPSDPADSSVANSGVNRWGLANPAPAFLLGNAATIAFTYQGNGSGGGNRRAWYRSGTALEIALDLISPSLRLTYSSDAVDTGYPAANVTDGKPHLIIAAMALGSQILYIDGAQVWSGANANRSNPTSANFQVGGTDNTNYLSGGYDELIAWGRQITAAEVGSLYSAWNGGGSPAGPTVAWWDGSAIQPITLAGWWDGSAMQPLK